jgi:uncharacterized protein (DUF1697 family)
MKYAAFFRALNVGGYGLIKMQRLKEIFDEAGFNNVETYIQSGNIVFTSPEKDAALLEKKSEEILNREMNYISKTFIRTEKEISSIIKNNPFDSAKLSKDVVLYYAFLGSKPGSLEQENILSYNSDTENHSVSGKGIYSLIVKNKGKTLYSGGWLEKKLKQPLTVRNWNTLLKINEMFKIPD